MPTKKYEKTLYRADYQAFIAHLKKCRKEAGITQKMLGKMLGQDQTFVSKYETHVRCIDLFETIDICKCLKIPFDEIERLFIE